MFHGSMESVLSAFFLGWAGSSLLALPTHTTLSCTGAASGVGKSRKQHFSLKSTALLEIVG